MACLIFLTCVVIIFAYANRDRRDIAFCEELGCNVIKCTDGQWRPL